MSKVLERFKAASNSGVPLLAIAGPDPKATMLAIYNQAIIASKATYVCADGTELVLKNRPVVQWDIVRGVMPWNDAGTAMLAALVGAQAIENEKGELALDTRVAADIKAKTTLPPAALSFAVGFYPGTVFFFLNVHRHIDNPVVSQAIWNLRDEFKRDKRMLVMYAPDFTPSAELKNDVVVVDEPLPTERELESIIVKSYKNAGLEKPKDDVLLKAVDEIAGLAAFPAETSAAMALTPKGIDIEVLGEHRRQQIKGIPGAELYAGKETFADVVGCANVLSLYNDILASPVERFRLLILLDEFEKMNAGSQGDTSGASQGINEAFLTWSQNSRVLGVVSTGVAGAGKTLSVKAAAGQYKIPLMMASMSAVKGSHVGESERNIRRLFKAADAMAAGGRILMVATSNRPNDLTPEQLSRFRLGVIFFDFPTEAENAALWQLYRKKYNVKDTVIPASVNWTGREIEACCELSGITQKPLKESAKRIVPVSQAKAEEIAEQKRHAHKRFMSANGEGVYVYDEKVVTTGPLGSVSNARAVSISN